MQVIDLALQCAVSYPGWCYVLASASAQALAAKDPISGLNLALGTMRLRLARASMLQELKKVQAVTALAARAAAAAAGGSAAPPLAAAVLGEGQTGSMAAAAAALAAGGSQWRKLLEAYQRGLVTEAERCGAVGLQDWRTMLAERAAGGPTHTAAGAIRDLTAQLPQLMESWATDKEAEEVAEVLGAVAAAESAMTGRAPLSYLQGHLYTCPNGHMYVIGECGQAMQASRCPTCDATIGGGGHRLAAGNQAATGLLDRMAEMLR